MVTRGTHKHIHASEHAVGGIDPLDLDQLETAFGDLLLWQIDTSGTDEVGQPSGTIRFSNGANNFASTFLYIQAANTHDQGFGEGALIGSPVGTGGVWRVGTVLYLVEVNHGGAGVWASFTIDSIAVAGGSVKLGVTGAIDQGWAVWPDETNVTLFWSNYSHDILDNVSADDHHAKSHGHTGGDGSGTVAHSDTTGKTANDHHNEAHALDPGSGVHTGTLDAADVVFPKVGTPDYETLADWFNQHGSSGIINDTTYVTDLDATHVRVAAGQGLLRTTDSTDGDLKFIEWPQIDLVVPTTAQSVRYIGVEYNAGTPQAVVRTDFDWNWNNDFPLAKVYHDGTNRHVLNANAHAEDVSNKTRRMLRETMPFARTVGTEGGGLIISDVGGGSQDILMTEGKIWHGFNEYDISEVDTSGAGTFNAYHRVSTGPTTWAMETGQTSWPNTKYDDGGADPMPSLGANKYMNLWWYVEAEDGELTMLYGWGQYSTQAAAEAETPPSTTPGLLSDHARLLGRFIVQQGNSNAVAVQNTADTTFNTSGVTSHDDLSGVSADDHHTQSHDHSAAGDGQTLAPLAVNFTEAATTTDAVTAKVTGDAASRFVLNADGKQEWGNGTDAVDTNLYRSAANTLKTDDNLTVAGGTVTVGATALTEANLIDLTDSGATTLHTHSIAATITVQEGDSTVDASATTLDFDASDFNVTSSPAGEANIALAYGTSAGTPAEGNHTHTGSGGHAIYGDGSDGSDTLEQDGASRSWNTKSGSGASTVYTMTRDTFMTSLTINSGVTLKPDGWRLFVQGTLTNNGTITMSGTAGGNAADNTAGTAGLGPVAQSQSRTYLRNAAVSTANDGAVGTVAGAGGAPGSLASSNTYGLPVAAPVGGAGGRASTNAGGAGGAGPGAQGSHARSMHDFVELVHPVNTAISGDFAWSNFGTGGGGGAGFGASHGAGGGGGGGGGAFLICAKTIDNTSGTIAATGGNGGNGFGTALTNACGGGGGGGAGGLIGLVYDTYTGTSASVAGGTGGTPGGYTADGPTASPASASLATDNSTTISSASTSPANATDLVLVGVLMEDVAATPVATCTLSGTNGWNVTWTEIANVTFTGSGGAASARLTLFRGIPSSTTAGVITATISSGSFDGAYMVFGRFQGLDTSSSQGVVQSNTQSGTTGAITFSLSAFGNQKNPVVTLGSSYNGTTATNLVVPTPSLFTEVRLAGPGLLDSSKYYNVRLDYARRNETAPVYASSGASQLGIGGIAVELKADSSTGYGVAGEAGDLLSISNA